MSEALMKQPEKTSNEQISDALHEVANLLQAQGANGVRIGAYRVAAETVRHAKKSMCDIVDRRGTAGLMTLTGVGRGLANHIRQLADTGHLPLLDRLRGDYRAERILASVPDIGRRLARRIHKHLHVENLFELKAASDDGRLETVPEMGQNRIRAVQESLAVFEHRPRIS